MKYIPFFCEMNTHNHERLDTLIRALQPIRQQLLVHPLYSNVQSFENLQTFTQHHVYAVWDFMTLLKALQIRLTCVSLPWQPVGNADTRYFINEIVTGEESDVDEKGERCSHYELYLQAMKQLGVDSTAIDQFVERVTLENYQTFIKEYGLPESVQDFLQYTFETALHAPDHVLAAVFTFGREDLIPDMFIQIVRKLSVTYPEKLSIFKYYLERHIEVDGDEHSILGKKMVQVLCGNDDQKWIDATQASIKGLEMRHRLWDGVLNALQKK
ncbi:MULTISPECIES: DUF3050 domain-containing protein [Chitinophagaceae]